MRDGLAGYWEDVLCKYSKVMGAHIVAQQPRGPLVVGVRRHGRPRRPAQVAQPSPTLGGLRSTRTCLALRATTRVTGDSLHGNVSQQLYSNWKQPTQITFTIVTATRVHRASRFRE